MITAAITLGIGTVTLWTPYPVVGPAPPGGQGGPGGTVPPRERGDPRESSPQGGSDAGFTVTDEMIASLLAEPFPARRRPRVRLALLVPVAHGFAALATFMLAVLAAVGALLGSFPVRWRLGRCAAGARAPPVHPG